MMWYKSPDDVMKEYVNQIKRDLKSELVASIVRASEEIELDVVRGEKYRADNGFNAHVEAFLAACTYGEQGYVPSVYDINNLHKIMFPHGGVLRTNSVEISEASQQPIHHSQVYGALLEWTKDVKWLVDNLNKFNLDKLCHQIAFLHRQYEIIHPHADGNGRLGRVLVNMLIRYQSDRYYVKLVPNNRDEYIEYLDTNDIDSLGALIKKCIIQVR